MSPASTSSCLHCGAAIADDASSCWLCFTPITQTWRNVAAPNKTRARAASEHRDENGGYSLASLMLFVTEVCVVLGVWTIAHGVGILLGVIVFLLWIPTALRALPHTPRMVAAGSLLASMGAVLIFIAVAAAVACIAFVTLLTFVAAAFAEACGRFPGV